MIGDAPQPIAEVDFKTGIVGLCCAVAHYCFLETYISFFGNYLSSLSFASIKSAR
jgi:hypothetical protein